MTRQSHRTFAPAVLALLLCLVAPPALAHGHDQHDPESKFHRDYGLLARFVFHADQIGQQRIDSTVEGTELQLHGEAAIRSNETGTMLFNEGVDGWAEVVATGPDGQLPLPTQAMTACAWVQVREPLAWGGFIGHLQDNGDFEKGWVLGYRNDKFCFGLATTGTDDGNGAMTYLESAESFATDQWYHVAATYDGATMRLYVNGNLSATSDAQSGDILYPDNAPYAVACYRDDNEYHPMTGALQHIRVYDRWLDRKTILNVLEAAPSMRGAAAVRLPFRMIVHPYLQWSTKTSMTIRFETNEDGIGTVAYGTQFPLEHRVQVASRDGMYEAVLTGLTPQSSYFYRVAVESETGEVLESGDLTFQTTVHDDTPFSFVAIGDTQNNPAVTRIVSDFAWKHRPNFLIHCGDLVGTGPNKREWVYEFFDAAKDTLSRFPMFPTLGNHEQDAQLYYDYFSMPDPEYYYDFRYGNAHFFVLDTNKDCSPTSEQYQWLDRQLARSDATWKIVYHHQPAYTSDSNDYGDTFRESSTHGDMMVQSNLPPLYEKHGVDLVFNGHIHVYERTHPIRGNRFDPDRGVRYITTGGGGGHLEEFAPTPLWFSAHKFIGHHFCHIVVHGDQLSFKAYDIDGKLFDFFELSK